MIVGMEPAHNAGHGLGKRTVEESLAVIGQQASQLHHLVRDDDVGGVAADVGVGITRSVQAAFVVESGLDGELLTGFELLLPLLTHLDDFAAELMADDDGVFSHVVVHALVVGALRGGLVAAHAQRIGNNAGEDFVLADGRQLKAFQPEVVLPIKSDSFRNHLFSSIVLI